MASLDEVKITREGDYAVVESHDSSVGSTKSQVGPLVANMSDQEVLDLHNDLIRCQRGSEGSLRTHRRGSTWSATDCLLSI